MKTKQKKLTKRDVMNEIDRVANERRKKEKPVAGHVCGLKHSIITVTVESDDKDLYRILQRKFYSSEPVDVLIDQRRFEAVVTRRLDTNKGTRYGLEMYNE